MTSRLKALALTLVCVALALFDLKLLGDFSVQRAINDTYASDGATAPPASLEIEPVDSPAAMAGRVPVPGAAQDTNLRVADQGPVGAEDAAFLRMIADPRLRQQLIAERGLDRRKDLRGADRALGIDADRWIMLSDRLAEAEVEARARRLNCASDPACPQNAPEIELMRRVQHAAEIAREVLGEAKAQEFEAFQETLNERHAVETLQARLRDASLSPQRVDELIHALHDEGARIKREWAGGAAVSASSSVAWPDLGGAAFPDSATTPEQRYAAVSEYSRRMRERAAPLLSAGQRAVFDSLQDELLQRFERVERRRRRGG